MASLSFGTVVISSTIGRDVVLRAFVSLGSTARRNRGAFVGSLVKAQIVMDPVAMKRSSWRYAKVWLVPLELSYSQGLTRPELRRMREIAEEHQATLLERWNEHFANR